MESDYSITNLLTKASRIITQTYQKALAPYDITPPQGGILWILNIKGDMPQVEIAKLLHLDKANVNSITKKLIDAGFIGTRRAKEDARKIEVYLTARGKKNVRNFIKIDQKISKEFSKIAGNKEELRIIKKYLEHIVFEK